MTLMSNTNTPRRSRRLIAAASAWALASLGTSAADAGLMMDVRVIGATGAAVYDPKLVQFFVPGDTITLGVFARVTGTDGVNNEQGKSAYGLMNSVGGLKGDLS